MMRTETPRSQPTYEELKREGRGIGGIVLDRSQPTYEELKPPGPVESEQVFHVPSLPMRN